MSLLDRFSMKDKVAVITGGGRGIGRAIALAFAENGGSVVVASRTEEQLAEVVAEAESLGGQGLAVPCDVSDLDNLAGVVDQAVDHFGQLDVVVNNAGGSMPQAFLDTSVKAFEGAFHFNVTTAFQLTQLATPHLLAQGGGAVLNISSAMGRLTDRGFVAYGTAKGALSHFTRLLATDLAPKIRVNGIAVGSVATSALEIVLTDETLRNEMVEGTPLRRLGEPEDIAIGALWLCSDAGSFVTGKVVEIDGGIEFPNLSLNMPDL